MNPQRLSLVVLVTVSIIATVATSACAPARVRTREEIRGRFGAIGVVADAPEALQGGFRRPITSRQEAAEAASRVFFHNLARDAVPVPDPRILLELALLPVIGTVGAVSAALYGAAAAESPEAVEVGAAALRRALVKLDASRQLRDRVIRRFAKRGPYSDVVAHDPAMGDPPETVRTLVRVSVTSIQLSGVGVNPRL